MTGRRALAIALDHADAAVAIALAKLYDDGTFTRQEAEAVLAPIIGIPAPECRSWRIDYREEE